MQHFCYLAGIGTSIIMYLKTQWHLLTAVNSWDHKYVAAAENSLLCITYYIMEINDTKVLYMYYIYYVYILYIICI